jgi:hypothetical protein
MPSIGAALLDCLCPVERGDFCVGGTREIVMPTIDVDGVGRIAFPVLPAQAERLVAIAEAAPMDGARRRSSIATSIEPGRSTPAGFASAGAIGRRASPRSIS